MKEGQTHMKKYNVYFDSEAYEGLTEKEANEMIERVTRNYKVDGYIVTLETMYDYDYNEVNYFINDYIK